MTNKTLDSFLKESIEALKANGLYNMIDLLEEPNGPFIKMIGREFINLSSNNYLGLATNERLKKAAILVIEQYGAGSGAVRTIYGTFDLQVLLEEKLAAFKHTEAAIDLKSRENYMHSFSHPVQ